MRKPTKTIAVIGAGPAGFAAAITAAKSCLSIRNRPADGPCGTAWYPAKYGLQLQQVVAANPTLSEVLRKII
ncbi:hypothetical protein GF406_04915 [candidate division KSB1 bacterium]|nr:hypothetical protein [candidate division KSB1 bacterium]